MTDSRVDFNLLKQPASTGSTTNYTTKTSFGDNLILAGFALAGNNSRTNMLRAAYNNPCSCFNYGYGGNLFPVPGLDASDVLARTRLMDNFNGITDILKGVQGGGGTSGITDDITAIEKTTNPAESFSKLDYKKIKEMAEKEQEIADKEAALKEEKDKKEASDKEKIKTLSKELSSLRKAYQKMDKELGEGKELSKSFGGNDHFYRNISENEFTQIQDINKEIKDMKDELKKLEEEGSKLAQEYSRTKQQLLNVGKAIDDKSVLAAMKDSSRTRFTQITKDREDKISEIEAKIKELKSFVEKAGKNGDDSDFYIHTEEEVTKAKEKASAPSTIAKEINNTMFADGKLKDKDTVLNELSEGKSVQEKDNIETVLDLMYKNVSSDTSEEDYKKTLGSEGFFKNMQETNDLLNNPKAVALLQKTYDSVMGLGKFNENGKKYASTLNGTPYWSLVEEAIKKANSTATTPTQTSTPTTTRLNASKVDSKIQENNDKKYIGDALANGYVDGSIYKDGILLVNNQQLNELSPQNRIYISMGYNRNSDGKILANDKNGKDVALTTDNIKSGDINVNNISPVALLAALKTGQLRLTDFDHKNSDESQYIGQILKKLNNFGKDLGESKLLHRNWNLFESHDVEYTDTDEYRTIDDTLDDVDVGKCSTKGYGNVQEFVDTLYNKVNEKRLSIGLPELN